MAKRIEAIQGLALDIEVTALAGFARFCFREDHFRGQQTGRGTKNRRGENVPRAQSFHAGVNGHDSGRNCREASSHQRHDFAPGHFREIRPDNERGFILTKKNIGCSGQTFTAAGAHRFHHDPRHCSHDLLQRPPVIQNGRKRRDENDCRGNRNSKNKTLSGTKRFLERVRVSEWSKNHLRTFVRVNVELINNDLCSLKKAQTDRGLQNENGKGKLQNHSPDHGAPRKQFPI